MNIFLSEHITGKMPSGLILVIAKVASSDIIQRGERIFRRNVSPAALIADLVRESQELQDLLDRCLKFVRCFRGLNSTRPFGRMSTSASH
jgi:hypothetical protein